MNQRDFEILHRFLSNHNSEIASIDCCSLVVAVLEAMDDLASDPLASQRLTDRIDELVSNKFAKDTSANLADSESPEQAYWIATSYLLNLSTHLSSSWDKVFAPYCERLGKASQLANAFSDLRTLISTIPISGGISHLHSWIPNDNLLEDVLAVHFIWMSAILGQYGDKNLYRKVASTISLKKPFFLAYLAAGCIKRQDVIDVLDGEPVTTEQYDCMHLLDCFSHLPGPPCL